MLELIEKYWLEAAMGGILAYITLIARRTHINALIKIGILLVLFYYLGSLYTGLLSPPSDLSINKYLIYQF